MSTNPWNTYWLDRVHQEIRSRNYSRETEKNYVLAVRTYLEWRPGNPKDSSVQELRAFLRHLQEERGLGASTVNLYRDGLAFFFQHILKKHFLIRPIPRLKEKQVLPDVLNTQSISKLLDALDNPKHRLALSLAYGCGFRVSELTALKIQDIDFSRKTVFIRQGKGQKDRVVMLPDSLAPAVRSYLETYRPKTYLFESRQGGHLHKRTFQSVFKSACTKAGLKQPGGIHSLRHSFATHLLENGTHMKFIQMLLGHAKMETTERYARVSTAEVAAQTQSPFDALTLDVV
jgi:site-specific recombinase XerD